MLEITDPIDGAVLNRRNGRQDEQGLVVSVQGQAEAGSKVTVNGVLASRAGQDFTADVSLRQAENEILAVAEGPSGRQQCRVRVLWDRHSKPRYRFAIDDNSFFLRDIFRQGYRSLFDCFYLDALRKLNRSYGAKFVLNCFFRTPEDDFNLPQFPDRYRAEWRDNAGWLKLAFHAFAEFPDRPYQDADPAILASDLDSVAEQIVRFAGPQTYSPPTVIHWAMLRSDALPVLAGRGVKALSTHLRQERGGWDINYKLDDEHCRYLLGHDAWKDYASGIVFSNIDLVCNLTPLPRIAPVLEKMAADPDTAELLDLFTHEQYTWPFYKNYIPDHFARIESAVRWASRHGYEPVFFHEGLLGAQEG
jgi:hypothetical protein